MSVTRFTALMALPWVVAVSIEYVAFRLFFASDLDAGSDPSVTLEDAGAPGFAITTLVLTLLGFGVVSVFGLSPAWAAIGGAVVLAGRALRQQRTTLPALVQAINVPFLAFVLALAIVVRAVVDNGLDTVLGDVMPGGDSLPSLLAAAVLAAVLANVINNLPAAPVLIPLAVPFGTGGVLAVLLGVNLGPDLTYAGSLATLLWRRVLRAHDAEPALGEFTRLGLISVPAVLVGSVVALWGGLHVIGG